MQPDNTPPSHTSSAGPAGVVAALVMAAAVVVGYEGYVASVEADPVGIPTWCFGETQRRIQGHAPRRAECAAILLARLVEANAAVDRCVHVPLQPVQRAGLISFTYNVGDGAFCASTLVARLNASDANACAELSRWVYARGRQLPGLVKRRAEERAMCTATWQPPADLDDMTSLLFAPTLGARP